LRNRFLRTPNVRVETADSGSADDIRGLPSGFDTALCLNVLEYLEDPAATLAALRDTLADGGRLLVLVPQGKRLFGTIDQTLGHRRRFNRTELVELLTGAGFVVEEITSLNRAGAPAWWIFGQVLGRRQINKITLKLFDKGVWLWRRIDGLLPWPGVSLVAVARKKS
jgi:SAM-dependent methyltransferase